MSTAPFLRNLALVMPPVQKMDIWLSAVEVLRLTGKTDRWLRQQVSDGVIIARQTTAKLPNGRFALEYAASSLPAAAQQKLAAEQRKLQPTSVAALPLFASARPEVLALPRAARIGEKAITESDYKMQYIEPILMWRDSKGFHPQLLLQDGTLVDSFSRMVKYQAEQWAAKGKPVSEATLWRWYREFKHGGINELARKKRRDAGQSDFFTRYQDAAFIVASVYLGDGGMAPKASITVCHETLQQMAPELGIAEAEVPSRKTVERFLRANIPATLETYARQGRRKFTEQMAPYLRRGYNEPANYIWVSDHMIADVEVQNDVFQGLPAGAPFRPRLTAIIDWRSRYVVGYVWCVEGSSASLATALRRAIAAHGPAVHFYCDNGKDYRKIAKGATPGPEAGYELEPTIEWLDEVGILRRAGIAVTHCQPYHPQAKHIERFFGTVHRRFCASWWTYTSGKSETRPDATNVQMSMHRRLLKHGRGSESTHPLASDFFAAFEVWLQEEYHQKPQDRSEGMDGCSPAEVFQTQFNPQQRPAPSKEELACMMAEHTRRKVRETAITLNGVRYVPNTPHASAMLFQLNQQDVLVAFDPLDPQEVAVLSETGHVLALLQAERLVGWAADDAATREAIADSMQMRRGLERGVKDQWAAISQRRRQLGVKSRAQVLLDKVSTRAELPAAVGEVITDRKPKFTKTTTATAPMYLEDVVAGFAALSEEE